MALLRRKTSFGGLKEALSIKGRRVDFDKKHYFELIDVLFVPFPYSGRSIDWKNYIGTFFGGVLVKSLNLIW